MGDVQRGSEKRAEARADLRNWTFATTRSGRANGDGGGEQLDDRHDRPDESTLEVVGLDGRIGSVPFGFGSE